MITIYIFAFSLLLIFVLKPLIQFTLSKTCRHFLALGPAGPSYGGVCITGGYQWGGGFYSYQIKFCVFQVRGTLKGWAKFWCVIKPGMLLIYKSAKVFELQCIQFIG